MADDLARLGWRIDEHDRSLSAGAESFARMREAIEATEKKAMRWLILAAFSAVSAVGGGAWWAAQRSSAIEATGHVVTDLRQDVSEARRELSEARRALDRLTQALEYQGQTDARQDAELQRLRDKAKR